MINNDFSLMCHYVQMQPTISTKLMELLSRDKIQEPQWEQEITGNIKP